MNTRIILAIAISAGMALLVTGVFYQVALRGSNAGSEQAEMIEIVTATTNLEIGATIQAQDLRIEPWPKNNIPEGAFSDIADVVERAAVSQILAGEPVLDRRLAMAGAGVGLASKVPEGMRAMSVRVDQVNGVAGFVFPEARVDVLVTGLPTDSPEQGQITRTILGNVRVLSAGEHLTPDATGKPQKVAVVTLLVEPQQAELVTLAQSRGQIQLVLRNSNDEQVPLTSGIREREVFGTGLAPVTNVERPALRRPIVQVAPPPPPAPPVEIEVIRGADRSIQTFPELMGN